MIAHILHSAQVATVLALTCLVAQAREAEVAPSGHGIDMVWNGKLSSARSTHLTPDDIGSLLRHPSFSGYSRLLLPWDGRSYDETMRLRDLGSLLPYHSHVDPGTVVAGFIAMRSQQETRKSPHLSGKASVAGICFLPETGHRKPG